MAAVLFLGLTVMSKPASRGAAVSSVIRWNEDKPHRCPRCHTITARGSQWEVNTCCNCGTRFTRWPRAQRLLRHVGVTCPKCTVQHPVPVDGECYGFLRRRHAGVGSDAQPLVEAWLYDTDRSPAHRDGIRYLNTRSSRAAAMADIAQCRSFADGEDDNSPVFAAVVDEQFSKTTVEDEVIGRGLLYRTLDVYGVGILRPHPDHGRFHADLETFTWGLIAPFGLEGLYTQAGLLPPALIAHAPQT